MWRGNIPGALAVICVDESTKKMVAGVSPKVTLSYPTQIRAGDRDCKATTG